MEGTRSWSLWAMWFMGGGVGIRMGVQMMVIILCGRRDGRDDVTLGNRWG